MLKWSKDMNEVYSTDVNGKLIEMIKRSEDNYYIYNNYNNRTIMGNNEVFEFLISNNRVNSDDPLYNFIEKRKKFNILEFNIFSVSVNTNFINSVSSFARITTNNFIVMFSLVITLAFIIFNNEFYDLNFLSSINIFLLLITIWGVELFLTTFHELSHFYYYQKFFKNPYARFGITIRYVSLFLFFTAVPFMHMINKKQKIKLILAGVKTQVTFSGILVLFLVLIPNLQSSFLVKMIFLINLTMIVVNMIPFLKLDGFWYISTVLNTDNYMSYYKNMLLKKEKFNIAFFILGSLNILLIMYLMGFTIYKIYNLEIIGDIHDFNN